MVPSLALSLREAESDSVRIPNFELREGQTVTSEKGHHDRPRRKPKGAPKLT